MEASAWKRLLHYHVWLLALVICATLWLCFYGVIMEDSERFQTLAWISVIFLLYFFWDTVLGADKHQEIKLKSTYCNIYVYNRGGYNSIWQDIIFVQDDTIAHIATKSTILKEPGYHFYDNAFRYCAEGNNNKWYYLNEVSDEPQLLGKKIAFGRRNVFLNEIKDDGTVVLCILNGKSLMYLSVDHFILGNAYVPPMAREDILYRSLSWHQIEEPVDEYLIVERNGEYKTYGLYFYYSETPTCLELSVSSIIFQDAKDRVILIRENDGYKLLCRKFSATRWIDCVIAELTEKFDNMGCIGGIVWRFDEETKQLQKLYEGRYHALGFADGSIVGDGWEYMPDSDEGMEVELVVAD